MGLLNELPAGIAEITDCKNCGTEQMSKKTASMVAVRSVPTNFSYEGKGDRSTQNNETGKGGFSR